MEQLRYLGILDSVRIRRESYPIKINYNNFYKKYSDIESRLGTYTEHV